MTHILKSITEFQDYLIPQPERQHNTRKVVVQKIIHQFQTHPDREALKADLKQNQAYNPFSEKSKDMTLPDVLREGHSLLQMRDLPKWRSQYTQAEQGSIWCTIDSKLRDKESSNSWRASWKHWRTKNLSRSSQRG